MNRIWLWAFGLGVVCGAAWMSMHVWSVRHEVARAAPTTKPDAASLIRRADELVTAKDTAGALPLYREAVGVSPDDLPLRAKLADLLAASGKADEAITEYGQILKRAPDDTNAMYQRAKAEYQAGKAILVPLRSSTSVNFGHQTQIVMGRSGNVTDSDARHGRSSPQSRRYRLLSV